MSIRLVLVLTTTEFLYNKAFKSDSQRLAFSLRSSIAKRRSHLNAALALFSNLNLQGIKVKNRYEN
ncbi:hypothetical protein D8T49_24080 [Vibrio vulnificus]|nr:hypothetical protein [Vibrio vulnificus]EGQ9240355.1 hypothetical protein [Vibrio vulnificus]EGQ9330283.1 hypothetical protein [Vibrio vulnificus]EGQ9784785.1 hypothetical protein [Vibrio vulnificus]EGR0089090.1 hypothetical protein [Vibrio vulnificus]